MNNVQMMGNDVRELVTPLFLNIIYLLIHIFEIIFWKYRPYNIMLIDFPTLILFERYYAKLLLSKKIHVYTYIYIHI